MIPNPFLPPAPPAAPAAPAVPNPFTSLAPPPLQPVDAPAPNPDDALNDAQLTAEYIALRNKKKALADAHALELEPFTQRMGVIEATMLARLDASGVESVRTTQGTAFKKTTRVFNVADPEALFSWIEANGRLDMVARSIKQDAMREYAEENQTLPPGVDTFAKVAVQFRAK